MPSVIVPAESNFLLNPRHPAFERIALPFKKNLERLGIDARVRVVDPTQYKNRMDQFDYDGSFEKSGLTWVRLLPVDTDSGFRRVELGFDKRRLNQMVFYDNLEQTTVVMLKNVAVNEPVDAARFEFAVPEDVDVVGKPVAAESSAD